MTLSDFDMKLVKSALVRFCVGPARVGPVRVGLSLKVGYLSAPFWLGSWLGGVRRQSKNSCRSLLVRLIKAGRRVGTGVKSKQKHSGFLYFSEHPLKHVAFS